MACQLLKYTVRYTFSAVSHFNFPLSLYLHLPFCHHKCSYCDLNAYAGLEELIPEYMHSLIKETRGLATETPVHSIYLGGGTPSLTPLDLLAELFAALRGSFCLTDDCEISMEANPDTLDATYLNGLRSLGVNRLSLGAQSAQANELALFERTHTFQQVENAIHAARHVGFDNISVDLIYGVPGQTLASWQDTLKRTIDLDPDHFSIYALSIDFHTPMRAWVRRGLLAEPDPDLAADMYEWADEVLVAAGYRQYEISSWAKENAECGMMNDELTEAGKIPHSTFCIPRLACRHNLQYWRNLPYLGLGAGAHGCWGGYRYSNVASPTAYVQRMEARRAFKFPFSPALTESIPIDRKTEMDETMLTGLRLVQEGVRAEVFNKRFGVRLEEVYAKEIKEMKERRLIEMDERTIRLTREARLVSNLVFEKFV